MARLLRPTRGMLASSKASANWRSSTVRKPAFAKARAAPSGRPLRSQAFDASQYSSNDEGLRLMSDNSPSISVGSQSGLDPANVVHAESVVRLRRNYRRLIPPGKTAGRAGWRRWDASDMVRWSVAISNMDQRCPPTRRKPHKAKNQLAHVAVVPDAGVETLGGVWDPLGCGLDWCTEAYRAGPPQPFRRRIRRPGPMRRRAGKAVFDLSIVEGYDGPQPLD